MDISDINPGTATRGLFVRFKWLLVAALLLVFAVLCVSSALNESATYDETHYLGAGHHLIKTQRWDAVDSLLHPIFWTVWHDLPLLAEDIPSKIVNEFGGTDRGNMLMALHDDDSVLTRCRLMLLPFALLLGLIVYLWSTKLYGEAGGLFSLTCFCFCPNLLAHSGLMTPDITLSCFTVMTAWRLWELAKSPVRANLWWAGAAMGLMLLSKFTGLLMLPFFFMADVAFRSTTGQLNWHSRTNVWQELRHWIYLPVLALLMIFAAYGFKLGGFALPSGTWIVMPAAPYFQGGVYQFSQSTTPHMFFLMGMHSPAGWWYYYLIVCALKIPVPLLMMMAGLALIRRRLGMVWRADDWYLLLPFGLLFAYLSVFNTIQNGFRYLLPVYPLLLVWLGHYGIWLRQGLAKRTGLAVMALWLVGGTLAAWPYYLAYFNELAGGRTNGYHWLADSNVDWGQDLKQLKRYMDRNGIDKVQFAYFGTVDPAHYHIAYDYLPSPISTLHPPATGAGQKPARYVALSAFQYQDIAFTGTNGYATYYKYTPKAVVGGSILIFDLENLTLRPDEPGALKFRKFVGLADRKLPPDSCP